jgi:hypothetical protein
MKARGPRNQAERRMTRWGHEHILERMPKRVKATPAMLKRRQQLVAPPCGTLKHWHDQGDRRLNGLEKVRAAFSRSTLADNPETRQDASRGAPKAARARIRGEACIPA